MITDLKYFKNSYASSAGVSSVASTALGFATGFGASTTGGASETISNS